MILSDTYGHQVSVYHVPSHSGLEDNDAVNQVAEQGQLRSPLWTVNRLLGY